MSEGISVAFAGYGRFGRALGRRLLEVGARVRAWDPFGEVPDALRAEPADLVRDAEYVVLAVPVAQTGAVLRALLPHLEPRHLVLDTGSVKTKPAAVMEELLGRDVPWVATHPLFGPTSLARGEKPLRVVVCANRMHADAVARVRAFYGHIGCQIIEQDAEHHDEGMAQTHALAYFVAKGFMDAGIDLDSPIAPPSARAIARTIEAVREDAAHLFASLHRENPYAGESRRRLLEALTAVDQALRAPVPAGEQAHHETGVLHMDDLGEPPEQLVEARTVIDEIDAKLLGLLARRAEVSLRAAQAKADVGRGVRDPRREEELLARRRTRALELGLDSGAVDEIFQAVLRFSRRHQTTHGSDQERPST